MKQLLTTGLAVTVLAFAAMPAQAFGCRKKCCPPPDCCPPAVTWVEKTVTCYKPEWKEREVTCTVMVPVWTDKTHVCTVYNRVAKEGWKEVTCCKLVPVAVTDPCTGCTYTACKPVIEVQKVKCVVWECVPVQKEYTVKVCSFKPNNVVRKERYCVMVPYQTTVKVPVCVPVCY